MKSRRAAARYFSAAVVGILLWAVAGCSGAPPASVRARATASRGAHTMEECADTAGLDDPECGDDDDDDNGGGGGGGGGGSSGGSDCGDYGEPCCSGDIPCLSDFQCQNGICGYTCGAQSEACCKDGDACNHGLI